MSFPPAPPQPPIVPAPAVEPGAAPPPPPPPPPSGADAPPPPPPPAPAAPAAPAQPAPATPFAAVMAEFPPLPAPAAPGTRTPDAPAEVQVELPVGAAASLDLGAPLTHHAAPVAADATRAWWSPANALVLAVAALTWQFLSFYAREQLPDVKASGAELRGLDRLADLLPLADSGAAGPIVGVALAAGALALLLVGIRRGLREPVLQGIVGGIAALSLLLVVGIPALVG